MNRKFIASSALIASLSVMLLAGCSNDSDDGNPSNPDPNMATLTVRLTDAPADFEAVNITFSEVAAHLDSEWIMVTVDPVQVNLLDFSNGNTFEIGSADVPAGHYTQVRLKIDTANVVIDGASFPLSIPSNAKTGLKLGPQFTIEEGVAYEVIIDFDACRSVVRTGPPTNPSYKLKPHLRMITDAITGSISGQVQNPENVPFAFAIVTGDTVTSTRVEDGSGNFKLAFLPEASYAVSVADSLNQTYSATDVLVVPGGNSDLGQITLQ